MKAKVIASWSIYPNNYQFWLWGSHSFLKKMKDIATQAIL